MVDPIISSSAQKMGESTQAQTPTELRNVSEDEQQSFDQLVEQTDESRTTTGDNTNIIYQTQTDQQITGTTEAEAAGIKSDGGSFLDTLVNSTRELTQSVNDMNPDNFELTKGDLTSSNITETAIKLQDYINKSQMAGFEIKAAAKIADKMDTNAQTLMNRSN